MLKEQTRAALCDLLDGGGHVDVFGVIAMLLTALGTYGLVSYAARQRTHEIGIRIAIGANRRDLLGRFLYAAFGSAPRERCAGSCCR